MVEVTGSSPVLPTSPEKPRTPSAGFFVGVQRQACLVEWSPKETKRTPVRRLQRGCEGLPHVSTERSEVVQYCPQAQRSPAPQVRGFLLGSKDKLASSHDSDSAIRRGFGTFDPCQDSIFFSRRRSSQPPLGVNPPTKRLSRPSCPM